jgi:hypothetical protein
VLHRAVGGDVEHPPAYLEVAGGFARVEDRDGHARIPFDVPRLHMTLHAVDEQCSPSVSTQVWVTCGEPSGMRVEM